jgi:hypothetical protein
VRLPEVAGGLDRDWLAAKMLKPSSKMLIFIE